MRGYKCLWLLIGCLYLAGCSGQGAPQEWVPPPGRETPGGGQAGRPGGGGGGGEAEDPDIVALRESQQKAAAAKAAKAGNDGKSDPGKSDPAKANESKPNETKPAAGGGDSKPAGDEKAPAAEKAPAGDGTAATSSEYEADGAKPQETAASKSPPQGGASGLQPRPGSGPPVAEDDVAAMQESLRANAKRAEEGQTPAAGGANSLQPRAGSGPPVAEDDVAAMQESLRANAKPPAGGNTAAGGGLQPRPGSGPPVAEDDVAAMQQSLRNAARNPAGDSPNGADGNPPGAAGKLGRANGEFAGRGRLPGSEDDGPAESSEAPPPAGFFQQADASFLAFDEAGGERLVYAQWLSDDQVSSDHPLLWVGGIKEPRLFVRWGVAVVLDIPEDFRSTLPVIGSPGGPRAVTSTSGGSGRATSRARQAALAADDEIVPSAGRSTTTPVGGGTPGNLTTPVASLIYCTGDFGERLLKRFDMRSTASPPYYGKIITAVGRAASTTAAGAAQTGGRRGGRVFPGDEAAPSPPTAAAARTGQWVSPDPQFTAGTLRPGVWFLGVDDGKSEKKFVESAKKLGLDALIVFRVDVNARRTGAATSSTNAEVYNLKTGESQKTSDLNNEAVAKQREKSDADDDPIEKELDKLFAKFSDAQFKVGDLPELNPEVVAKRVAAIDVAAQPLAAAVEVLSYQRMGLLDEAAAIEVIQKALDEPTAQALVKGTPDERKAALTTWIEQHQADPAAASGEFR